MWEVNKMPTSIPKQELMMSGHAACAGCGAVLAMRYVLKALGEKTVVSVPASCWAVIPGNYPAEVLKVPMVYTPFAATGASISGIREGLDIKERKITMLLDLQVMAEQLT
jgi:2-oxoisovalerate ferredoxin oxidoreductase beta subunit